ncbi:MAG TPA: hypothetical protein VII00_09570 [bacterium]
MAMASRYVKGGVHPKYLALLATKLYATADDPDAGLRFAEDAFNVERDPNIKKELERRIKELTVEKDLKLLNSSIEEFYKKSGKKPAKLEELIAAGILRVLPEEPFGGEYIINKQGIAQSTTYKGSLRIDTSKFSEKMDKN